MNKKDIRFIKKAVKAVEKTFSYPLNHHIKGNYYTRYHDKEDGWVNGYCWLGAAGSGMNKNGADVHSILRDLGYNIVELNDVIGMSWQRINEILLESIKDVS